MRAAWFVCFINDTFIVTSGKTLELKLVYKALRLPLRLYAFAVTPYYKMSGQV